MENEGDPGIAVHMFLGMIFFFSICGLLWQQLYPYLQIFEHWFRNTNPLAQVACSLAMFLFFMFSPVLMFGLWLAVYRFTGLEFLVEKIYEKCDR